MKTPLINEYETWNENGQNLSKTFINMIDEFVKDACSKHDTLHVEQILISCLTCACSEYRLKAALEKKDRRKRE